MEFIDKDSFRVIGSDRPDGPRPEKFEPAEDVVVFARIKKKGLRSGRKSDRDASPPKGR